MSEIRLLQAIKKLRDKLLEVEKLAKIQPKNGKDGLDGKNGKDGVGIKDAYINDEGHLIIVFTDDEEKDCGKVVGKDGKPGKDGLSVKPIHGIGIAEVKIVDSYLMVYLTDGKIINAGKVATEAGEVVEKDPIFANSPAYSITNENINSWNDKVEDNNYVHTDNNYTSEEKTKLEGIEENANNYVLPDDVVQDASYVHTDNNFTNELKSQITTDQKRIDNNIEKIAKLDKDKADKTEVEKITPKTYTAKLDLEGVLLETNASYESIANDMGNNTPINLLVEWNNEQISMDIAEIKTDIDNPHIMFLGHVRNADSSFLFWFYVQSNNQNFCEIKSVDNELLMLDASLNVSGALVSTTAEYEAIKEAVLKNKEVIIQTTWHEETFYMRLGEWKAGYTPQYFSFYGFVRNGYECREFFLHIGQNGEHTFADNRAYQMKDELIKDWATGDTTVNAPTAELCYNSFMRKPVIIYDNANGFEASNNDAGDTWHLTGLDLKPYKRLKFYVRSGGDGDANYSPSHIVEMHLDDRAKGSFGYFSADHAGHCPNNRNRHHIVTFIVNAEKTAIQFQHSISIYGTAASNSAGGRSCYLIEGYYD